LEVVQILEASSASLKKDGAPVDLTAGRNAQHSRPGFPLPVEPTMTPQTSGNGEPAAGEKLR
jgi:hypothetical protein